MFDYTYVQHVHSLKCPSDYILFFAKLFATSTSFQIVYLTREPKKNKD